MGHIIITETNRGSIEFSEQFLLPPDSFFYEKDVAKVLNQTSEKPIKGVQIIGATFKKEDGTIEDANVAVAVTDSENESGTPQGILIGIGHIIAPTCPPFKDITEGKLIKLYENNAPL